MLSYRHDNGYCTCSTQVRTSIYGYALCVLNGYCAAEPTPNPLCENLPADSQPFCDGNTVLSCNSGYVTWEENCDGECADGWCI